MHLFRILDEDIRSKAVLEGRGLYPIFSVKRGSKNIYGHRVVIPRPCTVVYDYENGRWGAKSWIETYEQPIIVGECLTFAEIQASMAAST